MKNLSNVEIEDFLSRCKRERVEGRTTVYNGKTYAIPYSTVKIREVKISGLRENEERIKLFRNKITENTKKRKSYLDVGCNLGVFVRSFEDLFEEVSGIDYDEYYIGQCRFLYEDIADRFRRFDLNQERIVSLSTEGYDVITALSMIEYVNDQSQFVSDLHDMTNELCIIEGHSEDINKGLDIKYENIIKSFSWSVERLKETTDVGINAPVNTIATGRPVWICRK